jgi:hypothetical protein
MQGVTGVILRNKSYELEPFHIKHLLKQAKKTVFC